MLVSLIEYVNKKPRKKYFPSPFCYFKVLFRGNGLASPRFLCFWTIQGGISRSALFQLSLNILFFDRVLHVEFLCHLSDGFPATGVRRLIPSRPFLSPHAPPLSFERDFEFGIFYLHVGKVSNNGNFVSGWHWGWVPQLLGLLYLLLFFSGGVSGCERGVRGAGEPPCRGTNTASQGRQLRHLNYDAESR